MNILKNWKTYNGPLFMAEFLRAAIYVKFFSQKKMHVFRQRYGRKRKISSEETNRLYRDLILSGKPFIAGRLGSAEMRRVHRFIMIRLGLAKHYKEDHLRSMMIHGDETIADWYCEQVIEAVKQLDLIPAWCLHAEPYLIRQYAKNAAVCHLEDIEPFFFDNPWTGALRGKKVLVVHPFVDTIKQQYAKRELLFENPDMLPEFELHVVKSVMQLTPEDTTFSCMQDAVEYMYQEAMKEDFDIALLACGPMGMPLASRLRKQGKQVIYMGGILQILFGIKGKRWDEQELYSKMYNEHWTYPIEPPPEGAKKLDNSCYWK